MDAIFRRRSVRVYTSETVPDGLVGKMLEAGMSAPSAGNQRLWHFIVVRQKQVLEALAGTSRHSSMAKDASLAVIVCGDLDLELKNGFWVQDCSAATENILIEAEELGLGAVWVGIYPREERVAHVRKTLNLPRNVIPLSMIPVGYPAERFETISRYDESRVHYDKWELKKGGRL